jgi:hypothetical protein
LTLFNCRELLTEGQNGSGDGKWVHNGGKAVTALPKARTNSARCCGFLPVLTSLIGNTLSNDRRRNNRRQNRVANEHQHRLVMEGEYAFKAAQAVSLTSAIPARERLCPQFLAKRSSRVVHSTCLVSNEKAAATSATGQVPAAVHCPAETALPGMSLEGFD